jgi:hypothetical protein
VSESPAVRRQRPGAIQQDWMAWLPNEANQAFEQLRQELSVSCVVLSVIVNEALSEPNGLTLDAAPQLALLFLGLFDRSVQQLGTVLNALEEHAGSCGRCPSAAPLRPEYFRSRRARYLARASRLRSNLPFTNRSEFAPKLGAIRKVIAGLLRQARNEAQEIAGGQSECARDHWARLEILQYDLNTCAQETTVVLKSFFCALPGSKLRPFRNRLLPV